MPTETPTPSPVPGGDNVNAGNPVQAEDQKADDNAHFSEIVGFDDQRSNAYSISLQSTAATRGS